MSRRLLQLYAGLILYGASLALQVRATLGLEPWDVFHQGLSEKTGLSFGTIVIIIGALVLLAWIPLRQKPGIGTISNVIVVGLAADATLALLPEVHGLELQLPLLAAAMLLNGVAGAAYIGAGLGPGPRDGLMTGLVRITGRLGGERPHQHRGERAGRRLRARRHRRARDHPLRALDRPAAAGAAAGVHDPRAGPATAARSHLQERRSTGESSSSRQTSSTGIVTASGTSAHDPHVRRHVARDPRGGERDEVVARRPVRVVPDQAGDDGRRLEAGRGTATAGAG